jgi:methionyl aminopeptidase
MAIHLRSADEIEKMHRAGLIVHEVLNTLRGSVRPGMTTMDLEKLAEEKIAGKPGHPAFKGYRGYRCVLCTSVNRDRSRDSVTEAQVEGRRHRLHRLRHEVDGYFADSAVTVRSAT